VEDITIVKKARWQIERATGLRDGQRYNRLQEKHKAFATVMFQNGWAQEQNFDKEGSSEGKPGQQLSSCCLPIHDRNHGREVKPTAGEEWFASRLIIAV